jgi:hypothetical protein
MEAGMERWGVPVPAHDASEEKTELALVLDDAEVPRDPKRSRSDGPITVVGSKKRKRA